MSHDFDEIIPLRGTDSIKWNAYPEDVIPMWIADTDFRSPQPVIDALVKRARQGVFGYPADGAGFSGAVAHWQRTRFGWEIDPAWVEYTPTLVAALIYAIHAFTAPGEKVLIQTPVYHVFHRIIGGAGRIKAENAMILEDGAYRIDFEDLEAKLADPATRLMLLCHPHNPLGRVFTRDELLRIGALCRKHGVVVFSDEIHADLVFHCNRHIPFPCVAEELADICLVGMNPCKTFNVAGLRAAVVITSNQDLRERFRAAVWAASGNNRNVFGVAALEACYREGAPYADQMVEYLKENVNFLGGYLERNVPGVRMIRPGATYLIWLDCRGLNLDQPALNAFFLEKARLALSDGESFGADGRGFMRMNVACPRSVLHQALERLAGAVRALRA